MDDCEYTYPDWWIQDEIHLKTFFSLRSHRKSIYAPFFNPPGLKEYGLVEFYRKLPENLLNEIRSFRKKSRCL